MGQIILGLGTSHSPQLTVPGDKWHLLREKDENDPRMDYAELVRKARPEIGKEITDKIVRNRVESCMKALSVLRDTISKASPDVMVVVGDDQHENFLDDNMPAICIFRGKSVHIVRRTGIKAEWKAIEEGGKPVGTYPAEPALAEHIIRHLVNNSFDLASSNQLKPDMGLGHAFTFIYRYILPEGNIPIVPVMVNTFYPPNRPTPSRCYALGRALRQAIEEWDSRKRVALIVSGGLSHVLLDEELDRSTIKAMREKNADYLCGLSDEKIYPPGSPGTSEICNWVVAAGALEPLDMTLVEYLPVYRSPAGTGCGMTFAYWK